MQESFEEEFSEFDIAIIGMSGRFPGADSVEQYWANLCEGKESISFFSDEELEQNGVGPELYNKPNYVKAAPVLNEPGAFDARFFGYSPKEANATDPQHRLFLECAWEALEFAGYDVERIDKPVGVFGGAAMNTYLLHSGLLPQFSEDYLPTLIGNDNSFLATRVSYKLNLKGPSLTIQTACSSSLVAVHTACQNLLNHECDMALAGGVAIRVPHRAGHLYHEHSVFSPDGHCRTFDAKANGTIFGSGAGIVVLRRLEDALHDDDTIYAVIKGTAVNNDGSSKVDYTAPSVTAQSHVIAEALANANVSAETISYVEAHGTGTNLGDPIEVTALTQAYRNDTDKSQFCALGSVKPNIGHLDAAAGVAGLIKTVLALHHQKIPASINFESPNPQIDFENSPFFVNTDLREWESHEHPRRAGISSLGIGGTNAHVVLQEAPKSHRNLDVPSTGTSSDHAQPELLLLSARTEPALEQYAVHLSRHLVDNPSLDMSSVAYTLREGRKQFAHRSYIVGADIADASTKLANLKLTTSPGVSADAGKPSIVFMFPGQGAQYTEMGCHLYEREAVFRAAVDQCAELLSPYMDMDIRHVLYPSIYGDNSVSTPQPGLINETSWAQPAIFTIEYAMAQLLMEHGIVPDAVIGHSVGEYAAACIAGIFSLEDALTIVAKRGQLIQSLPTGDMLAVSLNYDELDTYLNGHLSLAASNSPGRSVVSGEENAIAKLSQTLSEMGVANQLLHTSHAFHSSMMAPIVDDFKAHIQTVTSSQAAVRFLSTVTGNELTNDEYLAPTYWVNNLRQPVRFMAAANSLMADNNLFAVEVGPGTTLSTFVRQNDNYDKSQHVVVSSMRHPQDSSGDAVTLLNLLGKAWQQGISIESLNAQTAANQRRLRLPTYPFERDVFWYTPSAKARKHSTESSPRSILPVGGFGPVSSFYTSTWVRGEQLDVSQDALATSNWLIVKNGQPIADELADYLRQREARAVLSVDYGGEYERINKNSFVLQAGQQESYVKLFAALADEQVLPDYVIFLAHNEDQSNFSWASAHQFARSFADLLHTCQSLGTIDSTQSVRVGIITHGLHDILGIESVTPRDALLLGPARVVGKEYRHLEAVAIDLDAHDSTVATNATATVEMVIAELIQPKLQNNTIGLRAHRRWIHTLDSIELQVPQLSNLVSMNRLRRQGVYLITGGHGGIGFTVAQFLLEQLDARVILCSRTPMPHRSEWERWCQEHDENDPISQRIDNLQRLGQKLDNVAIVEGNVADYEQMKTVVANVEEEFGTINGIIHAAGIVDDGLIATRSMEDPMRVFDAKVSGTVALGDLFAHRHLDFFVLCSSINAHVAPAGQVDYVAANAVLDHYATYGRKALGLPITSINWPGWSEVGLLARLEDSPWKKSQLAQSISPEVGLELFLQILAASHTNVIIDPIEAMSNANHRLASTAAVIDNDNSSSRALIKSDGANSADETSSEDEAFIAEIEALVCEMWEVVLGATNIDQTDSFFELGGSSLLATQLLTEISERLGIALELKDIFESPTVRELSQKLAEQLLLDFENE